MFDSACMGTFVAGATFIDERGPVETIFLGLGTRYPLDILKKAVDVLTRQKCWHSP